MKRIFVTILGGIWSSLLIAAPIALSWQELQSKWDQYQGQRVKITTPLVVCATMYDSLILAPERLYVPEERAYGLADGDSTMYWQLVEQNRLNHLKLECKYPFSLNLGATITGLEARVQGPRHLVTGAQPRFKNYVPSKQVVKPQKDELLICAANIQNYFVHVGGYATKRNTQGQHALQTYKVASALTHINADLYAICELEQGDEAPAELTNAMNALCHRDRYAFVVTDTVEKDTISVGFIYNKERLQPYGSLLFAYNESDSIWGIYAHRFMLQGWQQLASGEQFVVSLNHPRSRRGDPAEANRKRMHNTQSILRLLDKAMQDGVYTDPDVLLLGDYNGYAQEQPLQELVRAGYIDMVMAMDSLNYSYSYKGECGYLDRCYASPSMAAQITSLTPLHWNTDYYYSAAYYSKYNYKNRLIPKEAPKNIRSCMSPAAKKNLLFRYSDHDPLLITIRLKQ